MFKILATLFYCKGWLWLGIAKLKPLSLFISIFNIVKCFNKREMKSESGFSFAIASHPVQDHLWSNIELVECGRVQTRQTGRNARINPNPPTFCQITLQILSSFWLIHHQIYGLTSRQFSQSKYHPEWKEQKILRYNHYHYSELSFGERKTREGIWKKCPC